MPECEVCGCEEFDIADGLYFCMQCQTQSQEIRVEEQEDDYLTNLNVTSIIKTKSTRVKTRKKDAVTPGRPWETHEAFMLIIRHQVEALERLGAHPALRDVVWQLWTRYLANAKIAFCENRDETESETAEHRHLLREREEFPATVQEPDVKPVRRWKTIVKSGRPLGAERAKKIKQKKEMEKALEGEEFYEGDNPFDDNGSDDDEEGRKIKSHYLKYLENLVSEEEEEEEEEEVVGSDEDDVIISQRKKPSTARVRWLRINRPTYMRMQRTVCFLYLGLMYTNPLVMPHDINRWLASGAIPYNQASTLLPADIQFTSHDTVTFYSTRPYSVDSLLRETGRLALYLGLHSLPRVELHQLTSKYIVQLNLPGELHGLIFSLLEKHPPEFSHHRDARKVAVPNYAAMATAHVVITLKLLFGLDDSTEKQLSSFAEEVNEALGEDALFVWERWLCQQEASLCRQRGQQWAACPSEMRDVRDVRVCMDQFHRVKQTQRRITARHAARLTSRVGKQKKIQSCLGRLLDRVRSSDPTTSSNSSLDDSIFLSSQPKSQADDSVFSDTHDYNAGGRSPSSSQKPSSQNFDDDAQNFSSQDSGYGLTPGQSSQKSSASIGSNLEKDFSSSSVKYITDGMNFLEELDKHGLSDFTINSSCMENSNDDSASESEDSQRYDPSQDLFSSFKSQRPHEDSIKPPACKKRKMTAKFVKSMLKKSKERKARVCLDAEDLQKKLIRAYEQYHVYKRESLKEAKYHRSYERLLQVCSGIVGVEMEHLERYTQMLELVYICEFEHIDKRAKNMRQNFLTTHFGKSRKRFVTSATE